MIKVLLSIEISECDGQRSAWIADDRGGSGIEVTADNYEEFAEQVGMYVADYAFREDDSEE